MRKNVYTIEVMRPSGKSYRKVYEGRESQCLKRVPSLYNRWRMRCNGEIIRTSNQ